MSLDSFLRTMQTAVAQSTGSTFVEAEVHHVGVDGLYFTVKSWDAGKHVFGPAAWPAGSAAPAQGTPALVLFTGSGVEKPWILFPTAVTSGLTRKWAQDNSAGTTTTVTHGFGTRDVSVSVYDVAAYEEVDCDIVRTSVNVVTVTTESSLAAGVFLIVMIV